MDKDKRESRGRGTLLLVMKREPKAYVSCLKEFMEFGLRPSNHVIAIGPKQDGNTLHINASSLDSHPLVKLAYVLYWVRLTIIYSKSGLVEPPRKLSLLYPTREG